MSQLFDHVTWHFYSSYVFIDCFTENSRFLKLKYLFYRDIGFYTNLIPKSQRPVNLSYTVRMHYTVVHNSYFWKHGRIKYFVIFLYTWSGQCSIGWRKLTPLWTSCITVGILLWIASRNVSGFQKLALYRKLFRWASLIAHWQVLHQGSHLRLLQILFKALHQTKVDRSVPSCRSLSYRWFCCIKGKEEFQPLPWMGRWCNAVLNLLMLPIYTLG